MSKLLEALKPKEQETKVLIQARIPVDLFNFWKSFQEKNGSDWTKTVIAVLNDGKDQIIKSRKTG